MKNVQVEVEEDTLTLTVDLSQNFGDSKSGKTEIIATSQGNQQVENDSSICFSLNVYKYKSKPKGSKF